MASNDGNDTGPTSICAAPLSVEGGGGAGVPPYFEPVQFIPDAKLAPVAVTLEG